MVETSIPPPSDRLINVQIMRGIAALMVVVLHAQIIASSHPYLGSADFRPFHLIPLEAGVDIFFLISGFVITISSQKFILTRNVGEFVRRRLLRIVPIYWIVLTIWLLLALVKYKVTGEPVTTPNINANTIIGSYFFFPVDGMGFGEKFPFPILDVGWTLNFEMLFYALFSLCLLTGNRLFYVKITAIILIMVFAGQIFADLPLPWSFWTQPITLEFLAGVFLALIYRSGWRMHTMHQVILIGTGLAIWLLIKEGMFNHTPGMGSYSWPRLASCGLGAALIMGGVTLGRFHARGWMARVMSNLGNSSYSLYLTHVITFWFLRSILEELPIRPLTSWSLVLVLVAIAVAVAHAVHLMIEKPVTSYLDRITRNISPAANLIA